jgi:hypothetical protein
LQAGSFVNAGDIQLKTAADFAIECLFEQLFSSSCVYFNPVIGERILLSRCRTDIKTRIGDGDFRIRARAA